MTDNISVTINIIASSVRESFVCLEVAFSFSLTSGLLHAQLLD